MKAQELREQNDEDLRHRERDLRDQLFRLRIQNARGQLDMPQKLRLVRRDLARVQTVLRERSLAAGEAPVKIDWISVGLGLLALVAVGGLIPFWMWVYFVYNPPIK